MPHATPLETQGSFRLLYNLDIIRCFLSENQLNNQRSVMKEDQAKTTSTERYDAEALSLTIVINPRLLRDNGMNAAQNGVSKGQLL